jgi:hypothetical protein
MDWKNHETNLLNIIKSSLEDVYRNTTLSTHGLIRFNRFVSWIYLGRHVMNFVIINLCLILLISMETSDVTGEYY